MNNKPMYKAMTIAGSDTSGGAGMEADLKTMEEMGVYGMVALTCIVAQNPANNWSQQCTHYSKQSVYAGRPRRSGRSSGPAGLLRYRHHYRVLHSGLADSHLHRYLHYRARRHDTWHCHLS